MGKKNVEAIYPLSPMQRGLLFYSLQMRDDDPGVLHLRGRFEGPLEPTLFADAWERVMQRHPALRTVFRWKGLDEPLQIVLRSMDAPLTVEDWRADASERQHEHLESHLAADRARGIDLTQAPTMRLALFRTGETVWQFVWSCHHVLLDGWSGALVVQDAVALYNSLARGEPAALPAAAPFRDYVRWLKRQSETEAASFWRGELAGLTRPTPLPFDPPDASVDLSPGFERLGVAIPAHTLAALQAVARRHQVTLGTIIHGAWALVLGRYSGDDTVTFGSTASGRAIDLPGVEAMVGVLVNAVPVRVRLGEVMSALDVFRQIHATHAERTRYASSSPAQVHTWSDVPAHLRLFESLLVVENYPSSMSAGGPLRFSDLQGGVTSSHPLTILAHPDEALHLHLVYDRRRFAEDGMAQLLQHMQRALETVAEAPERSVADLLPEVAARPRVPDPEGGAHQGRRQLALGAAYVAPQLEVETQLVEIWEAVLNAGPIGIDDHFFALGGDSISSALIIARADEVGLKISPSDFFEHASIRSLARAIRQEGGGERGPYLVPLAPEGIAIPVFITHFSGRGLFGYRSLVRSFGSDHPVYGLQDAAEDDPNERFPSFDAMVERYAEEIRAFRPEGPYVLLGYSLGGPIAYAVATRLHRAGGEVERVFILETIPDNMPRAVHFRVMRRYMQRRIGHHVRALVREPTRAVDYLRGLKRTFHNHFSPPPSQLDLPEPGSDNGLYYRTLMRYYVPEPCPLSVTLIESTSNLYDFLPAWKYLAGEAAEIVRVEADEHVSVLLDAEHNGVGEIVRSRLDLARLRAEDRT